MNYLAVMVIFTSLTLQRGAAVSVTSVQFMTMELCLEAADFIHKTVTTPKVTAVCLVQSKRGPN